MAIAKGRNELQASIEDTALALVQLTNEIENNYYQKVRELTSQIKTVKQDNLDENSEIIECMANPAYGIRWLYDDMYRDMMNMLVVRVYSYAERYMKELLSRIPMDAGKAKKKGDGSFIDKYYSHLREKFNLTKQDLSEVWADYNDFHSLRKNLTHDYEYENKSINVNYILSNIEQIKELLLYVEKSSRVK